MVLEITIPARDATSKHARITTDAEVTEAIARVRQRGYDEDGFKFAFQSLRQFAEFEAKENRQKRSKAGADAKWKKQPPEK